MVSNEQYPKQYLYKRIVLARLFIDAHYSEKIDLNNIAGEAHFSKFHFLRLFKKIYGCTPNQHLIFLRLHKAEELLKKGLRVKEACLAVGFESSSTFSGLFRKLNQISPSEYQRKYFKRQQDISRTPLRFIPNCFAEQRG
jgi:AraC-like DNA-binding protein